MMNLHFQELYTSRLKLRRLTPEDALPFFTLLGSSESVAQYMLWKPHTSVEESIQSIQKAIRRYETGESCRWAITLRDTGELMGIIDLIPRDIPRGVCAFAYMLAESCWNRGYGTEALKAVMGYGFRECGVMEIAADHFAENPASGAVMRKAGMVYQKTIPGKYEKNGVLHDAHAYRITLTQWQQHP